MGKCKFCGLDAGILRDAHRACKVNYKDGTQRIVNLVRRAANRPQPKTQLEYRAAQKSPISVQQLQKKIESIAVSSFIHDHEVPSLVFEGWESAVRSAIRNADFTHKTEARLSGYGETLYLSRQMSSCPTWLQFLECRRKEKKRQTDQEMRRRQLVSEQVKKTKQVAVERAKESALIEARRIQEIRLKEEELKGHTGQEEAERKRRREHKVAVHKRKLEKEKNERKQLELLKPILDSIKNGRHIEPNIRIDETPFILQKTERLVRVFTDVEFFLEQGRPYYDSNAQKIYFKYDFRLVERGTLGLTTKHIYFVGDRKRFRIRYDRIVAFKEYPDGVGLNRAAQDAAHQKFVTGEGLFTYNLVSTLARRYSQSD